MPQNPARRRGLLARVRRALKWLGIGLVVLIVVGVIYQTAATEMDRRAYPPPGQLYNIDGHQMHIVCQGEGSPTVILEAGGGHFSATWGWVQQQSAQSTRVCAYDRAGYGWSEPGPDPRDAEHVAGELHDLLAQAAIEPPYVVVAHSVGGIYARVFHAQYPGEVIGLVLVDTTHPDNWARQGESIEALQAMAGVASVIARFGAVRLLMASQSFDLPDSARGALAADIASAEYWQTQQQDASAMRMSLDEARATDDLGDLPLAVVTAVDYPEGRGRDTELALQSELAALSSNSSFQIVEGARHITLLTNEAYAAQVSGAIGRVIEAARTSRPLTE